MINIAICEDEKEIACDLYKKLKIYFQQEKEEVSIFVFLGGEELLKEKQQFDIVLMDIKMSHLNGIETARKLKEQNNYCYIIFITAFKEYVFEAFDVEAYHYLLKPVEEKKLFSVLSKIKTKLEQDFNQVLLVKKNYSYYRINFKDILYFEVIDRKIYIHTVNGIFDYYEKMNILQKQLNCDFFRCHRSYIVHFSFVKGYENHYVLMDNGEKLPVSKSFQTDFSKRLVCYFEREAFS